MHKRLLPWYAVYGALILLSLQAGEPSLSVVLLLVVFGLFTYVSVKDRQALGTKPSSPSAPQAENPAQATAREQAPAKDPRQADTKPSAQRPAPAASSKTGHSTTPANLQDRLQQQEKAVHLLSEYVKWVVSVNLVAATGCVIKLQQEASTTAKPNAFAVVALIFFAVSTLITVVIFSILPSLLQMLPIRDDAGESGSIYRHQLNRYLSLQLLVWLQLFSFIVASALFLYWIMNPPVSAEDQSPAAAPAPPSATTAPLDITVVAATHEFTTTPFTLSPGDIVTIEAKGEVFDDINGHPTRSFPPEGIPDPKNEHPGDPLKPANHAALIGKVGEEGELFEIGREIISFESPSSGRLFLGINDGRFDDNRGEYVATVRVQRG